MWSILFIRLFVGLYTHEISIFLNNNSTKMSSYNWQCSEKIHHGKKQIGTVPMYINCTGTFTNLYLESFHMLYATYVHLLGPLLGTALSTPWPLYYGPFYTYLATSTTPSTPSWPLYYGIFSTFLAPLQLLGPSTAASSTHSWPLLHFRHHFYICFDCIIFLNNIA